MYNRWLVPHAMSCPDDNTIAMFAQGLLDGPSRDNVTKHVGGCPVCSALLAEGARAAAGGGTVRHEDTPSSREMTRPARAAGTPAEDSESDASGEDDAVLRLLQRGSAVGRYLILSPLGSGGLGDVYSAYDPELDRKVAIKVLKSDRVGTVDGENLRMRLLREAQALAKVSHANVVTVYDVGTVAEQVFIAMELVDGVTLRVWRAHAERTWKEVRDVFVAAGTGLAAAHEAGLVHRDFKPGNVVIGGDGDVQVLDFGLARAVAETRKRTTGVNLVSPQDRNILEEAITGPGTIMGTPAYMAPEQFRAGALDARADQFSFCVALFETLYGRRPFPGKDPAQLVTAIEAAKIDSVPGDTDVPAWVHRALVRGLSARPDDRYPSMEGLLHDLTRDRRSRRAWWMAGLGAAVVTALAAWGGATFGRAPVEPEEQRLVDGIATEASQAAAKAHYVYPPAEDPSQPTAYQKVRELEALTGVPRELASAAALELRHEFSSTLTRLGDTYWEREGGLPFAAEYYAAAVLFEPQNAHAIERSLMTPVQLAAFEHKAETSEFTDAELEAAEPLVILAEPDSDERKQRIAAISKRSKRRPSSATANLESLVGTAVPIERSEPTPAPAARELPAPPPVSVPSEPEVATKSTKRKPEPSAAPSVQPEAKLDPDAAKAEAKSGHTALRSGRPSVAKQHFHRALDANPKNASALIGLSQLHWDDSDYARAARYAKQAVAAAPNNGGYRIRLGDAYARLYRYAEARKQYERAQALGHAKAGDRLERLAQQTGR